MINNENLKHCPIRKALNILGGKWVFIILMELKKTKRYGEIKKTIPDISEKILIEKLRLLEKHKFIKRKNFNTIPPHVEYSLTALGKDTIKIIPSLIKIGEQLK